MWCLRLTRFLGCLLVVVTFGMSTPWAGPEKLERKQTSYPVVHVGLDYLFEQDTDGGLFDNEARTLGFKVGVYRHAGSFDLGLLVGHQGMGTFAASSGTHSVEAPRRLRGGASAAPTTDGARVSGNLDA